MDDYKITEVEDELIKKYQLTNDQDIAMYFFNKLGNSVLNIVYSKITTKFSSIPLDREDLVSFVWKSLDKGLKLYKTKKENMWTIWIHNTYFMAVKEIKKYFKNSELILNFADSWDKYQHEHNLVENARSIITFQKPSFKESLAPIIDYVASHNKTYTKTDIKKLLYLKSFGYSEREIAKKMNVSRRYVSSMIKHVLRLSKKFLSASNR